MNGLDRTVDWRASADERAWIDGAVRSIRDAIAVSLRHADRALLLLSGGSTPAPVLRVLAATELEWSNVVVSLVDERDVPADDAASNARLVRETLLRERAAAATFWPLREGATTLNEAVSLANERWDGARLPIAAALFGMGDDGHTASLFPRTDGLPLALEADGPYVVFDAHGCPGAGAWPRRITLTPHAWREAGQRILLLRGAAKRAVFDHALAGPDAFASPVLAAVDVAGRPLQVHWCAT